VTVAGDLLLWNARLIDGRGGPARERTAIEVRAGRIEALTDIAGATAPDSAIDVAGRTVLPGLIDAHNHVMSDLERSPEFGPRPALHGEEPRPIELRWFVLAIDLPLLERQLYAVIRVAFLICGTVWLLLLLNDFAELYLRRRIHVSHMGESIALLRLARRVADVRTRRSQRSEVPARTANRRGRGRVTRRPLLPCPR